jgi:hypothetical protein
LITNHFFHQNSPRIIKNSPDFIREQPISVSDYVQVSANLDAKQWDDNKKGLVTKQTEASYLVFSDYQVRIVIPGSLFEPRKISWARTLWKIWA